MTTLGLLLFAVGIALIYLSVTGKLLPLWGNVSQALSNTPLYHVGPGVGGSGK